MAYALSAWFDDEAEKTVRALWADLHDAEISSVFHTGPYRPHVTLAVCAALDVARFQDAFQPVWDALPPPQLRFDFVGVFHNQSTAGFLGVTPSPGLLDLQRSVFQTVRAQGLEPLPHYLPGQWNPHCSLAPDLNDTGLCAFLSYTRSLPLPLTAAVTRIGIIDTPAEVELAFVS